MRLIFRLIWPVVAQVAVPDDSGTALRRIGHRANRTEGDLGYLADADVDACRSEAEQVEIERHVDPLVPFDSSAAVVKNCSTLIPAESEEKGRLPLAHEVPIRTNWHRLYMVVPVVEIPLRADVTVASVRRSSRFPPLSGRQRL